VIIPDTLGGNTVVVLSGFNSSQLTAITIPTSVTTITDYAFYNNKLSTVTIPGSVTTIRSAAFSFNQLNTVVIIEDNITAYDSGIFQANPIQTFVHGTDIYTSSDSVTEECFVFDGTSTITDFLFADLSTIRSQNNACLNTNITIPTSIGGNSVTAIGSSAFFGNTLTSVTIPDSISTIGSSAFSGNKLTTVTIPDSVINIGDDAFSHNSIFEITIPDSVTTLGTDVFMKQVQQGGASFMDAYMGAFNSQICNDHLASIIYINVYASLDRVTALDLEDAVITEAEMGGDFNSDGDQSDIWNGQLINPARVTASYKDQSGNTIAPNTTFTGTGLSNYLAVDNPTNNLSLYYRAGGSFTVPTAPSIPGYSVVTTPNNISSLAAGNNIVEYVYKADSSGSGEHANTASLLTPSSTVTPFSLRPVTLTTPVGTNITSSSTVPESSLATQDGANQYPLGLVNFQMTTNQTNNQIVLTFETNLLPSQVTPRKFNPNTNTYNNLPTSANATVTETTIDGKHHLVLTYTLIDNGELDLDPTTGIVRDPVGLAVANSVYDELARTGNNTKNLVLLAGAIITTSLALAGGLVVRRKLVRR
jgi:hypothetical protein